MTQPEASCGVRLICPRCRRVDDQGQLHVSGLRDTSTQREAVLGALDEASALECMSEHCRACYPVVSGVPVVFRLPDSCAIEQSAWFGPGGPKTETLIAAVSGRDQASALVQDLARVCRWLRAGFGDWLGDGHRPHVGQMLDWLRTLELADHEALGSFGCAVGREAWEWPGPTVLLDAHLPSLLAARTLATEGRIATWSPGDNQRFDFVAPRAPNAKMALVCADVLDPPFEAHAFTRLLAANLLDSVSNPWLLLQQLAAATRERGWLAVSSPFAWRAEVTPRERWLSAILSMSDDQALKTLAATLELELVAERESSWSLVISERETVTYRSACMVFRK